MSVCYDIRFPALYTELARRGAQLIVVCASWGSGPGKLEQWTLLARARALDSMSYVAAVGQADPVGALTKSDPARARRPGWAAAWWPRRWARWSPRPAPTRSWWSPTSTSTEWPRLAKASRCCVTAPPLLRLIGQNQLG